MRSLVCVALLLLCVLQVEAEVKAVKLCGREFLRAVVYTCGGSRWRRLYQEAAAGPEGLSEALQASAESAGGSEVSKRDLNNILTTVCCQVGCRKSDLSFLC